MIDEQPLVRLREIREELRRVQPLLAERDRLITGAAGRYSQRQIGQAAGLSHAQVGRILERDGPLIY